MNINKKRIFCFLLIMFITLMSCSIISAADNSDNSIETATTNNEVSNNNVEHKETINNMANSHSALASTQSDDTFIEETDQNEVVDEQINNTKAIKKAKNTNSVKTLQTSLPTSGTVTLTDDVELSSGITLSGNLIINGNGHTIKYKGSGNLFTAGTNALSLNDVTVTGVNGYVINGGTGHELESSIFINNKGLWQTTEGDQEITIVNCNVNCSGTAIYTTNGHNHCIYNIYNSIFQGPYPIIRQHNWASFNSYNFIIIKNDGTPVMITDQTYTNNRDQNKVEGTQPIHEQMQANVDTTTYTSDVTITINALDVHINETNDINIRLTAKVKDRTVGVPYEYVYLTVTYEDGSTENIQGITNANGEVRKLTDHDGRVELPIIASEAGIVKVNVDFQGSRFKDNNNGKEIYIPTSKTQNYNVLKLPTTTIVSFDQSEAKLGGTVTLTAQVTSSYTNRTNSLVNTVVNEGIVKFYSGTTLIGQSQVSNGVSTYDYNVNKAGTNNIKAVFEETDHFEKSESTAKILEVAKDTVTLTVETPYKDIIGKNVNLKAIVVDSNSNPVTTGKVRFTLENGESKDITINNGQAVFTDYVIEKVDDYIVKAQYIENDNYYASEEKDIIVQGIKIPTKTTIDEVNDIVGKTVSITAHVTNQSDNTKVPQGTVTFKYNNDVIGTASVNDGTSTISVIFNNTITDGTIKAYYHDENDKYEDSESDTNSNLNIAKGETIIEVTPSAHGYVDTQVTIEAVVKDKNTGNIINVGKVNVNGESCYIVDGKVIYNYTVTTSSPVTVVSSLKVMMTMETLLTEKLLLLKI